MNVTQNASAHWVALAIQGNAKASGVQRNTSSETRGIISISTRSARGGHMLASCSCRSGMHPGQTLKVFLPTFRTKSRGCTERCPVVRTCNPTCNSGPTLSDRSHSTGDEKGRG
jgi:hypothetical protein